MNQTVKKILTMFITMLVLMTSMMATTTTVYAASYPKNKITVESSSVKIKNKKVTMMTGTSVKSDIIKYYTRIGKSNKNKYKSIRISSTKLKWSTSNKKIVAVDKNGTVTAKKPGRATITAKYKKCIYKIKVTVKKCTNHKWDKGKVTKAASCTTNGTIIYTCTLCKATSTRSIDMLEHTEEIIVAPGTCGRCRNCFYKPTSVDDLVIHSALTGHAHDSVWMSHCPSCGKVFWVSQYGDCAE